MPLWRSSRSRGDLAAPFPMYASFLCQCRFFAASSAFEWPRRRTTARASHSPAEPRCDRIRQSFRKEMQMPPTKQQHLDRTTAPKRILSLDGGGIRGILTLEYLDAIEGMLKNRSGREDFLLCDYFDLIGGTSTGSIIAAGLACGMSVH